MKTKAYSLAVWTGLVVSVVLIFAFVPKMQSDSLVIVALVIQFFLVVVGAFVSVAPERIQNYRMVLLGVFVVLGFDLFLVSRQQGRNTSAENAAAQANLSNALANLRASTTEIARVQSENTKLQEQLLASSNTISGLAKQTLSVSTGGDSFCYLHVQGEGQSGTVLSVALLGKGAYPVSQLAIRMTDLDLLHQLFTLGEVTAVNLAKADTNFSFPLPNRYSSFYRQIATLKLAEAVRSKRYNVEMHANNGTFTQILRIQLVGQRWKSATQVAVSYYDGRSGLALQEIAEGFPIGSLSQDQDWQSFSKLKRLTIR